MYKENLFELIRNEDVIIWAGAGLSIYAGYPSGTRLAEILIDNLSKPEIELINKNLLLPDLAEEYFKLKGNNKNSLIKVLKKTFIDFNPISTYCHDNLALIPHFKTIITTNYDNLFENSYGNKSQLIFSSKHVPYFEKDKIQIFKVHGDLSEPESIIITKSDYNNFFKNNRENDIYWTVIKERLSTKSVLFLGYNLEDPNISVIFDRITDTLNSHRKECFLVAPNLPQHKVNDLIKKGIHYINLKAEVLIEEIISNIKEHIIEDLESGKTSSDTFRDFLSDMDLLPELKSNRNVFKLSSIRGVNENIKGEVKFSFKNEHDFIKELNDFISGKKFGSFEISEDKIINADFRYGGLKFPNPDGISKLEFKSIPRLTTSVDIRFDNGFEFTDIPLKLYGSSSIIEIHVELKNAQIILNLNISNLPEIDVNFNYKHNEICSNVKEEIEFYKLMNNLGNGIKFTVFTKSGTTYSNVFPNLDPLSEESQFFITYFNNLKIIEQHYNIRFQNININSITRSSYNIVHTVLSVINGKSKKYAWDDELTMELYDNSEQTIELLKKVNEASTPISVQHKIEEVIELHEQKINLGYKKIKFLEAYVSNIEAIIKGEENIVRVKSKNKKIVVSYTKKDEV